MTWWPWRIPTHPTYAVCAECRVHFDPDGVSQFAQYCQTHRTLLIEAKRREDRLIYWAKQHLDAVEKLKAREDKKAAKARKLASPTPLLSNQAQMYLAQQQRIAPAQAPWTLFGALGMRARS